jgi:hypothetical protein
LRLSPAGLGAQTSKDFIGRDATAGLEILLGTVQSRVKAGAVFVFQIVSLVYGHQLDHGALRQIHRLV